MKRESAKIKGKQAEREAAEIISKLAGKKYRRVPMSGALHLDLPFDLMKMEQGESIFDNVGIEVKNQKRLDIPDWIEQIKIACEDAGMPFPKWFIMFKRKGEFYFVLNRKFFEWLCEKASTTNLKNPDSSTQS